MSNETNAANVVNATNTVSSAVPGYGSLQGFELIQRIASMFSNSTIVPESFRGSQNLGNCVIALEMANRMGVSPLLLMQNMYIVYGNPSWSSKFLIAMFNQCGRYTSIKYRETGKKGTDSQGIVAYATEKLTGETIEGPEVTIGIAKAEGWYSKNGSKWRTMPDQMLRYRAAAWFIRTTAPELSMGLQTDDEIIDVTPDPIEAAKREIKENANREAFMPEPDPLPATKKEEPPVPVQQEAPKEEAAPAAKPATKEEAAPAGPGF